MAGTITHAFFAEDIAKKINFNDKYINNLKTFSQGHDMYFFLITYIGKDLIIID